MPFISPRYVMTITTMGIRNGGVPLKPLTLEGEMKLSKTPGNITFLLNSNNQKQIKTNHELKIKYHNKQPNRT